jgi:iron complex transport system substrate-binding protein
MKWVLSFLVFGLVVLGISLIRLPTIKPPYVKQTSGKNYQRVIALAPSMSETIEALGQAHRLVGVTTHCRSKAVLHLPKIGSFAEPNFEAIMALNPDLVVAVPHVMAKRILERLSENNVEVFAHQPDSLDDIRFIVTQLAEIFNVKNQGIKLNEKINQALVIAREQINSASSGQKTTALIAVSTTPFVVAGKNTFPSQIIGELGFYNLASSEAVPWPIWPLENLLTSPPQVLILSSDEHRLGFLRITTSLGIKPHTIRVLVPKRPIFNSPSPAIIEDIAHLTTLLASDV